MKENTNSPHIDGKGAESETTDTVAAATIADEVTTIEETIAMLERDESLSEEMRSALIQAAQRIKEHDSDKDPLGLKTPPSSHETWLAIKEAIREDGIKGVFFSEENDGHAMLQYGIGDGSGQHLNIIVVYDPEASSVMIRAKYPFYVDRRMLPIARKHICNRCWAMRYTRLEIGEQDGEIVLNTIIPHTSHEGLPVMFETLLHLVHHSAFVEYETLERYSRCELSQEERDAFLEEIQNIAPVIQG